MKENKRNIIAIFMVMLFACYHISIVSFAHVHNINGTSILHSHPFSDSGNNHTHDTSEISLINSLTTNPYILYSDLNIDLSEVLEIKDIYGKRSSMILSCFHNSNTQLRAPPTLFI